jgi:2-succinyl-5-enolpyruvyl-6-hydroxy-3-cyclohexene-1-carboxylate synthase
MVRRFENPGVARTEGFDTWRTLARSLWLAARGTVGPAGPVHLNAAFFEPLIGEALLLPAPLEVPAPDSSSSVVARLDVDGRRVLCVVGPGVDLETIEHCVALDWVVLGDATARCTVAYFDPLLRDGAFVDKAAPDLVVRLGGLPASKVLQEQLGRWDVTTVALSGAGTVADPQRQVSTTITGLPHRDSPGLRGDRAYAAMWREASTRVDEWFMTHESGSDLLDEPGVARLVVEASARHAVALLVGSSMPVRDVEWFAPTRQSLTFSNRGVNGIDGVVSTVLGVASGGAAIGLVGDLTMLHDVSALVEGLGEAGGRCVLVVVNNHGGGIFSFLPQASALSPERFERLFATPRRRNLAAIAEAFGHASVTVTTRAELSAVIDTGLVREGLTVVVAQVPSREENVRRHEALHLAIARCWSQDRE